MNIALVRPVSPAIVDCELTHVQRDPINFSKAHQQHTEYCRVLSELGLEVVKLPAQDDAPDGVFVEDAAVVVDEVGIIARMGAEKRRLELETFVPALSSFRPLSYMTAPAMLDGGDVLQIERTLYVGLSTRTNEAGARQLSDFVQPFGYVVKTIPVPQSLHLKTACSYLGEGTVLLNSAWVNRSYFDEFRIIDADRSEHFAGNSLRIGAHVLYAASFPKTKDILVSQGFSVRTIDISELMKAEAGLTCMSQIFSPRQPK